MTCKKCKGEGYVLVKNSKGALVEVSCNECHGVGKIFTKD